MLEGSHGNIAIIIHNVHAGSTLQRQICKHLPTHTQHLWSLYGNTQKRWPISSNIPIWAQLEPVISGVLPQCGGQAKLPLMALAELRMGCPCHHAHCTHRLGIGQVWFFLLSFYFNSRTLLHTKCNCRNNCRIQSLADKYYSGSKLGNHRTLFFFVLFFPPFFWVKFHFCCMVGTFIVFNTVFLNIKFCNKPPIYIKYN